MAELERLLDELLNELADRVAARVAERLGSAPTASASAPGAPTYLDTKEAATLLGVSVETLARFRAMGKGPPYIRVGRAVRYAMADLSQNFHLSGTRGSHPRPIPRPPRGTR